MHGIARSLSCTACNTSKMLTMNPRNLLSFEYSVTLRKETYIYYVLGGEFSRKLSEAFSAKKIKASHAVSLRDEECSTANDILSTPLDRFICWRVPTLRQILNGTLDDFGEYLDEKANQHVERDLFDSEEKSISTVALR